MRAPSPLSFTSDRTASDPPTPRWGIVATVKAPIERVLDFAAYHVELGAHRIHICLDEPDEKIRDVLKGHPKLRVRTCDAAHWRRLDIKRPVKHQVRQTMNATHIYNLRSEVDWLAHIDVDEFLWPQTDMGDILGRLRDDVLCARARPIESLAGDGRVFKGFIPAGPERERTVARLYPRYGRHVKGGFLGHLAGKLFIRTGQPDVIVKIHNMLRANVMNPGGIELDRVALCHCHVTDWESWIDAYRYRLKKGSYRAALARSGPHKLSMHDLLSTIEAESGVPGLRAFFDELCADTPALRAALESEGLLRVCNLDLAAKRRKHFPDYA